MTIVIFAIQTHLNFSKQNFHFTKSLLQKKKTLFFQNYSSIKYSINDNEKFRDKIISFLIENSGQLREKSKFWY